MLSVQDLQLKNRWWAKKNLKPIEAGWTRRKLFYLIKKNLSHPLILNIVGLRRVGKSTLLKQIISDLLEQGVDPENIFYYLFDYSNQAQTAEILEETISLYFSQIKREIITNLDEQIYIFLDEIQYVDNWQAVLKKYYDLSNQKIKFIIAGSQSILLKEKNKESLAGRIFDYYLPPLSFGEFLDVNKIQLEKIEKINLFDLSNKNYLDISNYCLNCGGKVFDLSKEYIISGQFPETRKLGAIENKQEYILESVLGKVLVDCIRIFNVDKGEKFKLVAHQFFNNAGSIFELKNIASTVGLSWITLEKYFEYLKEGFLFDVLFKYHKSVIQQGRILKKIYSSNVNFISALNHYDQDDINKFPEVFGKIVENMIFNILKEKFGLENLSFWRNGIEEIDFIVNNKKELLPIEVKFTNKINIKELKTIVNFINKKNIRYGIVVTKNELDQKQIGGKKIFFIPYYALLFLV